MAEWSNVPDSKSGVRFPRTVGSNPTLSAIQEKNFDIECNFEIIRKEAPDFVEKSGAFLYPMRIGYARVSTQEQETRAQIDALTKAGVDAVHEEKRSGANLRRPVLDKLLRNLKRGDVLVVYKLDRIARSLKHLLSIIDRLQERGAGFESLTEHIDTTSPAGRLMIQMLGAFAEFEREMIRERTKSGMQAAKKRGVRLGRPRSLECEDERRVVRQWRTGNYTLAALAHEYGVHLSSIKRAVYRAEERAQSAPIQ